LTPNANSLPRFTGSAAAVQFIRAIFSFEPDVIAEAKVRCKGTQVCIKANSERAKQAAPKKSK